MGGETEAKRQEKCLTKKELTLQETTTPHETGAATTPIKIKTARHFTRIVIINITAMVKEEVGTTIRILATTQVVSIFAMPILPESNFVGAEPAGQLTSSP